MTDGYKMKNVVLNGASKAVGASETGTVVSNVFGISTQDSLYFRAVVTAAGTTVAAGITAKLEHSYDGTLWAAVGNRAQASITTNGNVEITLMATDSSDAAQLPLLPLGRVVVDTGAGDAVTVSAVWVSRRT